MWQTVFSFMITFPMKNLSSAFHSILIYYARCSTTKIFGRIDCNTTPNSLFLSSPVCLSMRSVPSHKKVMEPENLFQLQGRRKVQKFGRAIANRPWAVWVSVKPPLYQILKNLGGAVAPLAPRFRLPWTKLLGILQRWRKCIQNHAAIFLF